MSRRSSTVSLSNEARSSKRLRAEGSDSRGSTERSGCKYGRCRRFGWLEDGKGPFHPFCEVWHRSFHMADLIKDRHGGACAREQPSGMCMLPGCGLLVRVIDRNTGEAYDFCRLGHADEYIKAFMEQCALEGRVCKLDGCINHVEVDERTEKIRDYCCSEHRFEATAVRVTQAVKERRRLEAAAVATGVASSAAPLGAPDGQSAKSIEGDPQPDLQAKIERERGYHSLDLHEEIEKCLKSLYVQPEDISLADPKGHFCPVENFTDSHPWEIVKGGTSLSRYFLHEIRAEGGNKRITTEGFRWRQSGPKHRNKSTEERLKTTYLSYSRHCHPDLYLESCHHCQDDGGMYRGVDEIWKLHEFSLSDTYAKELTGGTLPRKKPAISRISREKKGLPVDPPRPLETETRGKVLNAEGNNLPDPDTLAGPQEGPDSGWGGLQGTNTNGSCDFEFQGNPMELPADQYNVPVGAFGEVTDFEEGGTSSGLSSNGSPGEGPGRVQGTSFYGPVEFDGSEDFPRNVFMNVNERCAPLPVEMISEETGLICASGDSLPFGEICGSDFLESQMSPDNLLQSLFEDRNFAP